MPWTNEDVARQFASIAALLQLSGADSFRVRAYERAATAIATAQADIGELDETQLAQLHGVGASTAKKITEYLTTGSIEMLEDLRAKVPKGMLELTRVPGLGPKGAKTLYERLGVDSLEALKNAIEGERLRDVPGFGIKTEAKLKEAIARIGAKDTSRRPMADGIALADELCARLAKLPEAQRVTFAGSMRRGRDTIGDIDILVASDDPEPVHKAMRESYLVDEVIAAGDKKTSVRTHIGIQVDLRVVAPESFGAALVYFTGSKNHNVRVRERAVRRGLLVNEYGVFVKAGEDGAVGEMVAGATEGEVYAALGLQEIPPPMREDSGEVAAAAEGTLPRVVTIPDIVGDLHGHSDWSGDGKHTLETMVSAAQERGLQYWAVTDHAEDLTINGLTRERMLQRRVAIADLQQRYELRMLEGAELNIGRPGLSPADIIDYDPDFLADFEWCVASIHGEMRRPGPEQTDRIITAMQHPSVHAIGHLTGRILGRREPYDVELEAILAAAKDTGTALEINASPRRLDLNGEMIRRAVEAGVTLTISTDAHSTGDLASVRYGVWTAQRGWATPDLVLNTRPVEEVLAFARAKRERFS